MAQVALWWLIVTLLGWATLPVSFWLLGWLPERGYAFSRALGLLLISYLLWIGASLHLLSNDQGGIALAIFITLAFSAWLALRPGGNLAEIRTFVRDHRRLVLLMEALFAACFLLWCGLRAFAVGKVMPAGGEKFMETAFLNGILNSRQFPPLDPWLSGYAISYYYFGYVMMALVTRLSGVLPGIGFDLYDALLFALAALGAFGLVYNLVSASRPDRKGAGLAGLLGALFTVGVGNLEGLIEALYARGWLPSFFVQWLSIPDLASNAQVTGSFFPGLGAWWWWRASRVIEDLDLSGKPISLNPIDEFPYFSFLLGDNHPHILALPFALLAAAAALNLLLAYKEGEVREIEGFVALCATKPSISRLFPPLGGARLIIYALVTGSLVFLNTWDYPIYLGLGALGFLAARYATRGRLTRGQLWDTLKLAGVLALGALLLYGLFFIGFSSQAGGVLPYIFPPTRLAQYLVMFGLFIFILAFFLPASLRWGNQFSAQPFSLRRWLAWWLRLVLALVLFFLLLVGLAAGVLLIDQARGGQATLALQSYLGGGGVGLAVLNILGWRLRDPWLFLALTALLSLAAAGIWATPPRQPTPLAEPPEPQPPLDAGLLFARLIILTGLALTFSVEFFYLRDSFGVRMNTVFKFYFQGWVLLACGSAYAVWWMVERWREGAFRRVYSLFAAGSLVLVLASLIYTWQAGYSRAQGFTSQPNLDSDSEMRSQNPADWAAIDWLRANGRVNGQPPVILEAPGKSYTYAGRISTFTGFPAVLGWATHELQWRGSYTQQGLREVDIATIYTTSNAQTALDLLHKWKVNYVILGAAELNYIQTICGQAGQACNPNLVGVKFARFLHPVFEQRGIAIYAVPPD